MDPVTHGLAGAVIKNLGFRGRGALTVLVFSSLAPDLDYITLLWGAEVFLRYHRGITHGVLALFLAPPVIAFLFGRRERFIYFLPLSFIGYSSHLALDLAGGYGTRVMSPLDWQPYSLDLMFMVEPAVTAALLAGLLLVWRNRARARAIAVAVLLFLFVLVGVKYYFHERTTEFLSSTLDDHVICGISPLPNGFLRWWFVAKKEDGLKTGYADLFTDGIYLDRTYPPQSPDPAIGRSREAEVVKGFLAFARYPYAEIRRSEGKVRVRWKELYNPLSSGDRIVAEVTMDLKGKVLNSSLRL
jgi:inner membrane protein